jgi:signal transduction histidine kinase
MAVTHEQVLSANGNAWRRDDDTLPEGISARTDWREQMPALVWTTDKDLRITSVQGAGLDGAGLKPAAGMSLPDLFREEERRLAQGPAEEGKSVRQSGTDLKSILQQSGPDWQTAPQRGALAIHCRALSGRSGTFDFSRNDRAYFGRVEPLYNSWGQLSGTITVVLDISERVALESNRRQREAKTLEAHKNQSLTVLASGVAHNFNNLLTAILGYTSLALMKVSPSSPLSDILREVESAAQCAADLSGQMLVYAQRQKLHDDIININELIEQESALSQADLGTDVILSHDLGRVPLVTGDEEQLKRVFHSLLINAVEAVGAEMGTIAWKTRTVYADGAFLAENFPGEALSPGCYVLVQIADSGAGMDAETRARIFEPFFSTKFTGRGMGLAAALGIVHGHQGTIGVTSEPGAGTTVRVLLPALPPNS